MTQARKPEEMLEAILACDGRYARDAYIFVSEALTYTVQQRGESGHVTGRELCEGLAAFALGQFGRLARTVLTSWGLRRTEDIGEVVFNMVEEGLLRKTDEDSRDDFAGVLDLGDALDSGFELHLGSGGPDEHGSAT
jgi:uncharacterized repeat protein (TIGR04138 family)